MKSVETVIHQNPINKNTANRAVFWVVTCICIAAFSAVLTGIIVNEAVSFQLTDLILIPVFAAFLAVALYDLLRSETNAKIVLLLILAIGAGIRLAYILCVPHEPASDWAALYDAARQTVQGDLSWIAENGYFRRWAYQIPYVFYQAAILKMVPSLLALKLVNLVWMTGTILMIYLISRELTSEKPALCAAFLYTVFPEAISYSSELLNSHVATFLLLAGIYALLRSKHWYQGLLAGVLLGLSNLMRPVAIITILALICIAVWRVIQKPQKRTILQTAAFLLVIFAGYFLVMKGTAFLFQAANAAPYGIGNNFPEWKFVLGLNFSGKGGYDKSAEYILQIQDPAVRRAEAISYIKESYRSGGNPIVFFFKKLYIQWCHVNSDGWVLPIRITRPLNFVIYAAVWVLSLLELFRMKEDTVKNNMARFLYIIILGDILVYLLIESASRYRYNTVTFVFLMSSCMLSELRKKCMSHESGKEP